MLEVHLQLSVRLQLAIQVEWVLSRRVITRLAGFQILLLLIPRMQIAVVGLVTVMRTGTWNEAVDRRVEGSDNIY
jgi:hypothetical protein